MGTITRSFANLIKAAGPGKVLQVVSANDLTQRSTTSSSYVTASNTLSVTITPSSSSNKILIIVHSSGHISATTTQVYYTIYKESTNLGNGANGMANIYWASGASVQTPISMTYLDSPNTTSATTYQVYFKTASGTAYLNVSDSQSTITAFEIAG